MCKMCSKGNSMAKTAMGLSILSLILSVYVFFSQNEVFGIAGTQWILISIVLGVYSVFFIHLNDEGKKE
jgi:hypothetical protein